MRIVTQNGLIRLYENKSRKGFRVSWVEDGRKREKQFGFNKRQTREDAKLLADSYFQLVKEHLIIKGRRRLDSEDLSVELTEDDLN